MLKLKVCGMRLAANIAAVAELQPDYLGFIFYEKSPRFISEVSAELIRYIPAEIKTTGVFVNEDLEKVKEKISSLKLKAVQLHGSELPEYGAALKSSFPNIEVIKAFGIDEDFDFSVLEAYLGTADYFLFDTKTKAHGGSGKTFNWSVLNRYTYNKPYFLSGGIDLEHSTTIKKLNDSRLYALDINSRFETEPGLKDVAKIKEFIREMTI
ncbi:phosphoribosylanthranilate isomerase [Pedobacter zeae]|uniref:N-(5'-phosphoribosyl)anthranilate isomerase n=1 Tax=Pedobacter zeae TaxID=1737356 RepID=A0A7W6P6Y9_9SPHI|nr:phosphoribosylanthranilate isomerase [Pedobacter zeae]MBB4108456.1 phosphoribosylanthranilate isomerase [Pedobacter zeae]GGG92681.1 N-(5'-phosphoribosyl)anthranilate isomerase [Pedobacter zeae]